MKDKFINFFSATMCGIIFSSTPLIAFECSSHHHNHEKTFPVQGIEKNLELLRGSVYNRDFTQVGGTGSGGDIIGVVCPPLRPRKDIGFGFTTNSTITHVDITSQIATAVGATGTPGVVRAYTVSVNVTFDTPFKKDPSVVASLENNPPTVLSTPNVAVGSFGLFVNHVSRFGFTADLVLVLYGDTVANVNNVMAFVLTPGIEEGFPQAGGGIAFNFNATAPKEIN